MNMRNTLTVLLFICLISSAYSQTEKKIGLSGSIQGDQLGILVPIWLGEKFVLAPAFQINYAETIGTDIGIGVVPRFYIKKEKLAPYIGFKIGVMMNKPSSDNSIDDKTKTDILGGVAFGGEYFIGDNFSLGVEAQGNMTKSGEDSNRYGNPNGFNFNTATMISATIYFR
jgi:hypothetical protein